MKNQNFFPVLFSLAVLLFLSTSQITLGQNWNFETTFPGGYPNRTGAIAVSVGTTAYFGSGITDEGGLAGDFWKYDMSTKAWTRLSDIPGLPRFYAFSFAIGNKIYVGGGLKNQLWASLNDFYVFDTATNTWSSLPNVPVGVGLAQTSAFTIQGKGYVACGFVYANESSGRTYVKSTYCYDPSTSTWTKKADFPGQARGFVIAFSMGNFGYVGGGIYIFSCCAQSILYEDFWQYNPVTDSWTRKSNVNNGVDGSGHLFGAISFSDCSNGFAVGGYYNLSWDSSSKAIQYDPGSDSWSTKASYPIAIASGVGWNLNGFIYAGFGYHVPNGVIYALNAYGSEIVSSQSEICSQSTFTLQNPSPYFTSVTWSASAGGVSLNTINSNTVVASRVNNFTGTTTITAAISGTCFSYSTSKTIWVGTPYVTFNIDAYPPPEPTCYYEGGIYTFQATQATGYPNDYSGYQWGWRNLSNNTDYTDPYGVSTQYTFFPWDPGNYEIWVRATNQCGTSALESVKNITVGGCFGMLTVYPNPSSNYLEIEIKGGEVKPSQLQSYEVVLFDSNGTEKLRTSTEAKTKRIDTSSLKNGKYILHVLYRGEVLERQIIINR